MPLPVLFKKRSKKAISHVDWAMSLAVFLLYLAWFFVFVKPIFSPSQNMDVLLDILDDGVTDNIFQDVERIQVYVPGDFDSEYEPLAISFSEDWSSSQITHTADYFEIDDGKMFFLANLSDTKKFKMYHPHSALEFSSLRPVNADEERARFESFSAHFDEYLLDTVYFLGETRLFDFSVEIDENEIDDNGEFDNMTLVAEYKRVGDYVNLSSYVFAENSRIYTYIKPTDYRNHSVVMDLTVYNYTYFYLDALSSGEMSYSIGPSCRYYTSDFLDLYDDNSGFLITFGRNISFRLCSNETNALVRLEFDLEAGEEDNMNIILHTGDAESVIGYPPEPIVGVTETLSTVSAEEVSLLKNRNYDYLKQLFHYPKARDFNITVTSDVVSASYGIEQPFVEDIYARKLEGVILDENYEHERVYITLTVW
jgi:hypothetical protein